ncbi:hypothetical protein [Longispora albida]|uniref:hypothetical protein n=1 Tax=Longispora albida TaxID=203523 RepID=UPI000377DD2D|nr:hypothetical protein [Longispora albida]
MSTDQQTAPPPAPPPATVEQHRIRRRLGERWLYVQTRRIEGRPVVPLDSVLGPFDGSFSARALVPLALLKGQYLEGQRYLVPDDWRLIRERIEEGVRTALTLPEPRVGAPDPVEAFLSTRAAEVGAELKALAQRRVQREYFKGTIFGVFASLLLLAILYLLIAACFELFADGLRGNNKILVEHALVAIGGGAGGATLSSLIRLRKQEVENHQASGIRAAAIRIMLGWFFAGAILFLVKGELVNIFKVPDAPLAVWFYWGALGFLGGFNEAWVTDLVTKKTADGAKDAAKKAVEDLKDLVKK